MSEYGDANMCNPISDTEFDDDDLGIPDRPPIMAYVAETTEGHAIVMGAAEMARQPAPDYRWDKERDEWVRPNSAVSKWADEAMYVAEPMPTGGPQVTLLSMTADPLGEIAACAKIYRGEVCRSLSEITDEERLSYFADMQRTALDAAFEVVQFHFLFENVTRAFTHQLIRQRLGAVYFQESMRFAVKEDMAKEAALPPSLEGTISLDAHIRACEAVGTDPDINASPTQQMRNIWDRALGTTDYAYRQLIDRGMPAEDARGLAPHATTTRVHYVTNLRAIKLHAGLRLCTQAQYEWRLVWARMIDAIRGKNVIREQRESDVDWFPPTAWGSVNGTTHVWMADKLVELFKPVCYQTGKCQFDASFDRHCSIRERVNAFEHAGIPSNGWHSEGWVDSARHPLLPIQPVEWLADPGAARVRG